MSGPDLAFFSWSRWKEKQHAQHLLGVRPQDPSHHLGEGATPTLGNSLTGEVLVTEAKGAEWGRTELLFLVHNFKKTLIFPIFEAFTWLIYQESRNADIK